MGAVWFPPVLRKGRGGYNKINVITRKDDLKEGEIEEEDVKSDPSKDTTDSKESSKEESDEDNDYMAHLYDFDDLTIDFRARVPLCFRRLFYIILS